jgi:8-oxo-dGTP pyrophosphatase MutT (NUDIX family)
MPLRCEYIRPVALCVFSNADRILVGADYNASRQVAFYRPLGGTIEFGEHSADAIVREIREELDAEITGVQFLGALENIFYEQGLGHEIDLIYDAQFVERASYEAAELQGIEDEDCAFSAVWKSLDFFVPGAPFLFPEGLKELLQNRQLQQTTAPYDAAAPVPLYLSDTYQPPAPNPHGPTVRPTAAIIIRAQDRLLVQDYAHTPDGRRVYRPPCGSIEPGETGRDCAARELCEELGVQAKRQQYLGVLEELYQHNDRLRHDIFMVYDITVADRSFYAQASVRGRECDGRTYELVWKSLSEFLRGEAVLHPQGLLEMLENKNLA